MLQSRLVERTNLDEVAWNRFVDASPQQYLYYYVWYLDAACPGWAAIIVSEKERWIAVWPLPVQQKAVFRYSFQPPLTQFLGPIFVPFDGERHRQYHYLKTAIEKALEALPPGLLALDLKLHPGVAFFPPFVWAKWEVAPRITYWLPIENSYETLEKRFSTSVTNHLKKARKNGLTIRQADDESQLIALALQEKIYNPVQAAFFKKIWAEVRQKNAGFLLYALDTKGQLCSAAAFILDKNRLIFFALLQDAAFKNSGGNALLVCEGIRRCFERPGTEYFDFEGSMLPPVEQYFRAFNPEMRTYYQVRKYRYPLIIKAFRWLTGAL
jgi:hypothetical protein